MYIITNPLYIAVNVNSFNVFTFGWIVEIIVNSTARSSHLQLNFSPSA